MTDSENIFECSDSIIKMVINAGEHIPPAKIESFYNALRDFIEGARKEEYDRCRLVDEWQITVKKSVARYRLTEDIMLDIADLWLRSDSVIRDDICKLAIGVSADNADFFRMMDCYHAELYQAEITDDETNSIFSSVDALKNALDNAIDKPQFRPSRETLATVYKYIAFGFNRARTDADIQKRLSEIGIDTSTGFCKMFRDLVICYGNDDNETQVELQRYFYRGIPWDALMFRNVMDRLWKYLFKEKQYEPIF